MKHTFYFLVLTFQVEKGSSQSQQKTTGKKLKRCLCIQTQTHPAPPENFVFDRVSFAECGGWHRITLIYLLISSVFERALDITLTHVRQQVTLYVDGKFVQTCSTFTYPHIPHTSHSRSSHQLLEGCVGRRLTLSSNNNHAYFCGQVGVMYCLEGVWDVSYSQILFETKKKKINKEKKKKRSVYFLLL